MPDHRKKLTPEQVSAIRIEHANGKTFQELAEKYDLAVSYAWKIVHGLAPKGLPKKFCPHCHQTIVS